MAISYNLRFVKETITFKKLLEKEGEIVFDRKFFKLKGKGANDIGEQIFFTDIKEYKVNKDFFIFSTFNNTKYLLSKFGSSFDDFLRDFFKLRNEFFAENLFMKLGMLTGQFECTVEITHQFGNYINKGYCMMQVYEESILFLPEMSDCFVVYLNFMKMHEFDEEEYVFNIELESGGKVRVSRLGSSFEQAKKAVEGSLEKMYQQVLNQLKQVLPDFSVQVLLKLAYQIRAGKAVSIKTLKKIDISLMPKILELALSGNEILEQKIQFLRSLDKDEELFLGLSFENGEKEWDVKVKAWFLCALPNMNSMVMGLTNDSKSKEILFFRIVMEQGIPSEKMFGKILEINQCMVLFNCDLAPLFKNKEDLKQSKYQIALMKLAFLRLFRRSLIGKSGNVTLEKFKIDAREFFTQAQILQSPTVRHRQIFKSTLK